MSLAQGKILSLVSLIAIWIIGLFYTFAKKEIWVRRLPAIDFIDESVGRAAEMGRPVIVQGLAADTGLESNNAPQIMANLDLLAYIARTCAKHGTTIYALQRNLNVFAVSTEVLRTAFRLEGKLDEFEANKEEMLPWLPDAANLVAFIMRVKPAFNLAVGPMGYEAMQVLDVGARVGAVQVAGTGRIYQIPVTAALCDMHIIGEEIYAVGAYISRAPEQLGSLRTIDIFKVATIVFIILGTILATGGGGAIEPLKALFNW